MSQVITSKPSNPSRKPDPGRFSWAGLCLPEPRALHPGRWARSTRPRFLPALLAQTLSSIKLLDFANTAGMCSPRGMKEPRSFHWPKHRIIYWHQGEPESREADHWSASLPPGKKQAQQHKPGVWTANPEWQSVNLSETQNTTFLVNYIYIFAIHLITMSVKPCSQIWWHSTTLSWREWFAVAAPSTSALNRSRQGDKLLQKLPQTLKLLLINMTNTATKPLSLPDASLLQFPSSSLVTSPHDCSHCPPSRLLSFSSSPRQALSWSVQDTEQDILAANPQKFISKWQEFQKVLTSLAVFL